MDKYISAEKLKRDLIDNRSFFPAIVARAIEDMPAADVVSTEGLKQIMWERDFAIDQLKSYGVGFAEKADVVRVVRCKDCSVWERREDDLIKCPYCFDLKEDNDFCSYGEAR